MIDTTMLIIEDYFNRVAQYIQDQFIFSYKYEVRLINDYYKHCVIVNIRIYDIDTTNFSGDFVEPLKLAFFAAADKFRYQSVPCSVDLRVNVEVELPIIPQYVDFKISCKEESAMYMPEVKEIIHKKSKKKGEVFTVKWTDNTETSVKLMEGDTSDEYVAFMYCMSIKMFGSKGACRQYIKDKKQVFEERVERRSEEIRQRKLKRVAEDKARREVPYAGGLRVPALCQSSMFKKNGGK